MSTICTSAPGRERLLHMHGELSSGLVPRLRRAHGLGGRHGDGHACARNAARPGALRPDIVWFGEMPYEMERIDRALMEADLFVSIGTSGNVYPAAGFVQTARYVGARTLEMNLEPSLGSYLFDESRTGQGGRAGAGWVEEMLNDRG